MEDLRYLDDVSTLVLDQEKCIGCTLCTQVCPQSVFEMQGNKSQIVDFNACMECGACVNNCPTQAIRVSPGVG
ncbi:MAG: 4Fe-4S dicluster domain-containing protein [Proteobacteria bacterium]|nr:4Fe-4S dicluster domain-containing protein [Pseudomonadota bacterium]MBU1388073.1 4Fe-4S dicluster domain-containing protein [Pseudomonadota bacterium]MBU1542136.1 4Fe-4S dicluster domain-containing protein [Pseudomonadota bacterium]MBU2429186.1 4Fe-4S dicluster domain-containing protein [Pseudomonadota bacterium]MBU2480944.1 4Fe-4S dicluster domain-containing protein [Pseudomonadota bacterium]